MTVGVAKTDAERGFGDLFRTQCETLPGDGWVAALRQSAMAAFEDQGLPSRRVEAFKYTDLRQCIGTAYGPARDGVGVDKAQLRKALGPLAVLDADLLVLVNGTYRDDLSSPDGLKSCGEFIALGPLLAKAPTWLEGKFDADRIGAFDPVTALNAALMRDGVMVKIKPGEMAERPILLAHVRAGAEPVGSYTRNIFAIEAGADATLIEAHIAIDGAGKGQTNSFADITVGEGGRLNHVVCRIGDGQEQDVVHNAVSVGASAQYKAMQLVAGAKLARSQGRIAMIGEGGMADISGVFLGRDHDHIDTTLVVDHLVAGCKSRETFKGVLDGKARGVFQGKVIVQAGAQKSDGQMMAQALMLSEDAEFDSKPELEIYADDVQCGHGSTCTDLDENLMFFCRSRGLSYDEARALLINGFVGELFDKLDDDAIAGALHRIASDWLTGRRDD